MAENFWINYFKWEGGGGYGVQTGNMDKASTRGSGP